MDELLEGSHSFRPLSSSEYHEWIAEFKLRAEDEREAIRRAREEAEAQA